MPAWTAMWILAIPRSHQFEGLSRSVVIAIQCPLVEQNSPRAPRTPTMEFWYLHKISPDWMILVQRLDVVKR